MLAAFRIAFRQLTKSPGFTLVAILTLALGIGANTSMFSLLNALIMRPLPFADSAHLDVLYRTTAQNPLGGMSPADYLSLPTKLDGYGEIAAYAHSDLSLAQPGQPAEIAKAIRISPNFFSLLGIPPELGRNLRPEETQLGNHRVLMISHRYWQNHFGGASDIIGRTVRVDGEAHEIVGVLPDSFSDWRVWGWVDLFRPLGFTTDEKTDRKSTELHLIGRRSGTLTSAQAEGLIASIGLRLAKDFPAANAETSWRAVPLNDTIVDATGKGILSMLVGLSLCVLLIACSNLANFLLARTMARAREFAVRSALGASRSQLLRPLITESLLLAFAGGLCAIIVALWATDWLTVRSRTDQGDNLVFTLDWLVLSWALFASFVTALAFGLAPALFALRLDINRTLKSSSRSSTGDRSHQRFRNFLLIGQFALAMVLLASAALFLRGAHTLNHRRHGWESDHLLSGTIILPTATYPDSEKITAFQRLAVESLEALPGVETACVATAMPFFGLSAPRKVVVEGRDLPLPGHEPVAAINGVSPHYFATVGTRFHLGRTFNESDTATSPKVFIINQAMAQGLFGKESPLGQHLAQAGGNTIEWGEIIGVVSDIKSVYPEPNPVIYQLYQPMSQAAVAYNEIAVRTTGEVASSALIEKIRMTMNALNPDLPVRNLYPADTLITRANRDWGTLSDMLSALALLGLGLAALGIYGVITRTVAQRANEFGVRIALGAQSGDITHLVLTTGVKLALIGSAFGLLGAYGVTQLIATGLPGMQTNSAPVLIGVTLLLVGIALLACWLPARRATKVDPMVALRAE